MAEKTGLKKVIGRRTLLFITINAILGTGIFFLPAVGAVYAGAGSLLSWIIMTVIAVFISVYFAELISMFPKSGGIYEFVKNAFGEFYSFLFGWIAWIVANITISMLIVGSIIYLFPQASIFFNMILAVGFIIFFNYISYRGMNVSSKMLLFFGVMTVLTLLVLIVPGIPQINISYFDPLLAVPLPLIFIAIYFISETFFGWEMTTYLSEEIKNARKVLPKTLVIATFIIGIISILIVTVLIGSFGGALGSQKVPLVALASELFGQNFSSIFAILIFIPLIGTAASWIVSSPRLLYAMSRDGVLFPIFSRLHKNHGTPYNAIIFQTIVACIVSVMAFANYMILLSLLLPLVIILYSGVMLSVVKLRISRPRTKRYFKAPFGKIGPLVIVGFNLLLILTWLNEVANSIPILVIGIFLILIGIPAYLLIKLETDNMFTEKWFDKFSWFTSKMFPLWYTKCDIKKVVSGAQLKKGQTVLDFGSGTGTTALAVAKKIGENGTMVAVDLSEKQLERAIKNVEKALDYSNVIFIKERELAPFGRVFDAITCVGVLEHFPNPEKDLKKLLALLKKNGHFSFMSFGRSLGMPAPAHLKTEDAIKNIFHSAGVNPKVTREKKKGVVYWFISGSK